MPQNAFGHMVNTLHKYKSSTAPTQPNNKPARDHFSPSVTMTGHKEKIGPNGNKQYHKILHNYAGEDDAETRRDTKAVQKTNTQNNTGVKRSRGRPAGKYNGTYKPRDPAQKAAAAAKSAASKAANRAKRMQTHTESVESVLGDLTKTQLIEFLVSEDFRSLPREVMEEVGTFIRGRISAEVNESSAVDLNSVEFVKPLDTPVAGIEIRAMDKYVREAGSTHFFSKFIK